ncbi:MAG: sigma-70 family RNA polymerase sigma factor [Thermoanaerobaculia bacterium]|nr:sigma-70 family RNA polymerase sigma factor [Thermoanaerobaculia bacterium]
MDRPVEGRSAAEGAELVRRMAQGDAEALSELYDRYSGMLNGLALRVLTDAADAEEVLQEAFLQAWRQAGRYDPSRSSVSTWLVLITRSRAIDRLRSRKVVDRTAAAAHDENPRTHTSPSGTRNVLKSERQGRIRSELEKIPPEQREVLELAFFRGMTQREIAEETEIPLGTVKTRTLLAMKKLRRALADEIEELL